MAIAPFRPIEKSDENLIGNAWSSSMGRASHSLADLRQDLHETQSVIDILERASRELVTIISYDDAVRSNPLRGEQLTSIGEELAVARLHRVSLAREIERLAPRV